MDIAKTDLDQLCVTTIRMISIDAIEKAKSGHPGLPLGAAPMAYVLWMRFMNHNPANPNWQNRDRFVFSSGHGSMLLYSLLYLTGYGLTIEDIKNFRQWGSKTPGHPEYGITTGVESTSGPLGQGFAMGVGMAMAESILAKKFNKPGYPVIDHYTYGIVSDGDLMEGISHEAASIAGRQKLGKLIYLYDDNHISIDGPTELTFTEDVYLRFVSYGWHVVKVSDGNDLDRIEQSLSLAKQEKERPSLIIVRNHIGYGSPKQDSEKSHGEPLGQEALLKTKQYYNWPVDKPFYVPEEALSNFRKTIDCGTQKEKIWLEMFAGYKAKFPDEANILEKQLGAILPSGWNEETKNIRFTPDEPPVATRDTSGKILNVIAKKIENLIGGSADLAGSTKTLIKDSPILECAINSPEYGRNVYFGVREHAMGSITNGMAIHGGIIPYCSTFLVFSDYMRPSLRMASIMGAHSIFVFTHDSIGVGEDGPTHQPIEHLISLRAIPELIVLRPADANEVITCWELAIEIKKPVVIVLTRQKLPILPPDCRQNVKKGAYIISDSPAEPDIILIASGSEVYLAMQTQSKLKEQNICARVVSMPSWELFESQSEEYREMVLPKSVKAKLAIEAGSTLGWRKWVGDEGDIIGIDHFGASAPGEILFEKFGFTVDNICKRSIDLIRKLSPVK